ncbi:MAG TPA: hypothetical protein VEP49_20175 [Acidimicrobiia bacterium]|nr:hypothetical protein [Acidimicrobiia bacterium]
MRVATAQLPPVLVCGVTVVVFDDVELEELDPVDVDELVELEPPSSDE